jgi:hypothetical protein
MLKNILTISILMTGFSTLASAKSISNQIKEDGLKVAIDYSATINKQLITENICSSSYTATKFNSSGVPIKMLGYAHVYMGAGPGVSKFGHLGERFVYCKGSELHDMYYDGIKLTEASFPLFKADYPDATNEYITSTKALNALYYRKIQNPTQVNVYGSDTIRDNRNIYEQWLKISEKEMYDLLVKNINRVAGQTQLVSQEKQLPRFSDLKNNCTKEVTEDLKSIPTLKSITIESASRNETSESTNYLSLSDYLNTFVPKSVYQALTEAKVTEILVIYPSQDNMRKIFFKDSSFEKSIKLLEVPMINFNPKFAADWTDEELKQLESDLAGYQSPLAKFFKLKVSF